MHPACVLEVHPVDASVVDHPDMSTNQAGSIGVEHGGRGENGGQRTEVGGQEKKIYRESGLPAEGDIRL